MVLEAGSSTTRWPRTSSGGPRGLKSYQDIFKCLGWKSLRASRSPGTWFLSGMKFKTMLDRRVLLRGPGRPAEPRGEHPSGHQHRAWALPRHLQPLEAHRDPRKNVLGLSGRGEPSFSGPAPQLLLSTIGSPTLELTSQKQRCRVTKPRTSPGLSVTPSSRQATGTSGDVRLHGPHRVHPRFRKRLS